MLPRLFCAVALALLIALPRPGWGFEGGDPADPLGQYQIDFLRRNLGTALKIDQTRVDRLIQIEHKYKSQKRQAIQDARAALQQLQQVMSQPQPPEQDVAAILDRMMKLRQDKLALEQKQLAEQKSILTPVQQARYLLLFMSMRREIAKEAHKVRSAPQGVPLPAKPQPHEVPVSRPGRGY
jgi:Spy/CpxP family protein refolding chaperone